MPAVIRYHITPANARELAAKSLLARQATKQKQQLLLQEAAVAVAEAKELPEYILQRLARVRMQLDRIDEMLLVEKDPQKLDRLSSASGRLSIQERELSGRPLPGTLKPRSGKDTKRSPSVTDSPEQVAQPSPVTDTVTPPLTSVNAPVQPGISAMPENG